LESFPVSPATTKRSSLRRRSGQVLRLAQRFWGGGWAAIYFLLHRNWGDPQQFSFFDVFFRKKLRSLRFFTRFLVGIDRA
jgi:hypothetical protein